MIKEQLQLGHVAMSVSDLDKSIDFYKRVFGFECIKRFYIEALKAEACFLKKGDSTLELFNFKDFKPLPDYRKSLVTELKTLGVKHFAFKIKNIEEVYRYFKDTGIEFATEMRMGGSGLRYFFMKDPDNILIEVIEDEETN